MAMKRNRKIFSIKNTLIQKSSEAALAAVQIYNNPLITFKTESFIVLMIIAWTYLLHAFYRNKGVEYRYIDDVKSTDKRKIYQKTKYGEYKHWGLEKCLEIEISPISKTATRNLFFLIGLRHKIEHQMIPVIDEVFSARLQACCLNYNKYVTDLFGEEWAIGKHLLFSLQFSKLSKEQKDTLDEYNLPDNIKRYVKTFDNGLTAEEYNSEEYATRYLFVPKNANRVGQADRVIEFVKESSEMAKGLNKEYVMIKETEKEKFLPGQIVLKMIGLGFAKFNMDKFVRLWQDKDAKNPKYNFGGRVAGKTWYWYKPWVDFVEEHCKKNSSIYK
ncbi:MAG: DUF3644 domain-containing protein [Endomicrobia bacterium]|nr:DUF3644 domain-containing protein [Endomicrobiia bacterium]MCL2507258.1 DUF3644 domain-containing protein [Endomicrobiia bacterium]